MKTIIYIMNVDWNWIKQRPHFIAEGLSELYDIHVLYQYRYRRKGFQKRSVENIKINPIYVIPKGDRHLFTAKINLYIKASVVKRKIHSINPWGIYLSFPNQYEMIPSDYSGVIIYDCMDNHSEFIHNEIEKRKLIEQERRLLNRAEVIFVSSIKLMSVLKERYGKNIENKILLVRNAYNGQIIDIKKNNSKMKNDIFTFTYFGTISNWFNFKYIMKSLDDFSNIKYELFGPIDGIEIPKHDKIIYRGTIEHTELLQETYNTDCFIMPFVVNKIIESVDPVKLYEYINFNKNILCPFYYEIKRFQKFVHFYSDYDSYKKQIIKLLNEDTVSYSEKDRNDFLYVNNWSNRIKIIKEWIEAHD